MPSPCAWPAACRLAGCFRARLRCWLPRSLAPPRSAAAARPRRCPRLRRSPRRPRPQPSAPRGRCRRHPAKRSPPGLSGPAQNKALVQRRSGILVAHSCGWPQRWRPSSSTSLHSVASEKCTVSSTHLNALSSRENVLESPEPREKCHLVEPPVGDVHDRRFVRHIHCQVTAWLPAQNPLTDTRSGNPLLRVTQKFDGSSRGMLTQPFLAKMMEMSVGASPFADFLAASDQVLVLQRPDRQNQRQFYTAAKGRLDKGTKSKQQQLSTAIDRHDRPRSTHPPSACSSPSHVSPSDHLSGTACGGCLKSISGHSHAPVQRKRSATIRVGAFSGTDLCGRPAVGTRHDRDCVSKFGGKGNRELQQAGRPSLKAVRCRCGANHERPTVSWLPCRTALQAECLCLVNAASFG